MTLSRSKIILVVLVVIALFIGMWVWTTYNGFISAKESLDNTWAQVETQYQRRFDLIPNLQSIVKGAADFEQETFIAVTQARTQWQSAGSQTQKLGAINGFESALSRLLLTVENYPDLKATKNFGDFQVQLEGTENRIAVARRDYNNEVKRFNIFVRVFPRNMLAGTFGYEPAAFFGSVEEASGAPAIEL